MEALRLLLRWLGGRCPPGGLPGYVSKLTLVPDLALGVVVLTNQESSEAFYALTYQILDHYLGVGDTDWVDAFAEVAERRRHGRASEDAVVSGA